jgi:centrosomal protein CEP290
MRKQLADTEKLYIDAKEDIIAVKETNLSILNDYEGGATREDYEKVKSNVEDLEGKVQGLSIECEKLRSLTEISASQCAHLQRAQKSDLKEKELLQAAIKDLQMSEDSKFVIGQLHQRLLTLQKDKSAFSAQAQELKVKSQRLEKIILQVSYTFNLA